MVKVPKNRLRPQPLASHKVPEATDGIHSSCLRNHKIIYVAAPTSLPSSKHIINNARSVFVDPVMHRMRSRIANRATIKEPSLVPMKSIIQSTDLRRNLLPSSSELTARFVARRHGMEVRTALYFKTFVDLRWRMRLG